MKYVLALDLGKARDYTVPCVTEERLSTRKEVMGADPMGRANDNHPMMIYRLVHTERLPIKTGYLETIKYCKELLNRAPLAGNCDFVMDATGVGSAVTEMAIDEGLQVNPLTYTSGYNVGANDLGLTVPKAELVTCAQMIFNTERLKVNMSKQDTEKGRAYNEQVNTLIAELKAFKGHASKRTVQYGAATEADHDDMVMSLCMALWWHSNMSSSVVPNGSQKQPYDPLRFSPSRRK